MIIFTKSLNTLGYLCNKKNNNKIKIKNILGLFILKYEISYNVLNCLFFNKCWDNINNMILNHDKQI